MAKRAIKSIKGAEEEVRAILQKAMKDSQRSKEEAAIYAEKEYDRIIYEGEESARIIRDGLLKEGEQISKPELEGAQIEAEKILNLSSDKLEEAANIIIERVVNTNGNS